MRSTIEALTELVRVRPGSRTSGVFNIVFFSLSGRCAVSFALQLFAVQCFSNTTTNTSFTRSEVQCAFVGKKVNQNGSYNVLSVKVGRRRRLSAERLVRVLGPHISQFGELTPFCGLSVLQLILRELTLSIQSSSVHVSCTLTVITPISNTPISDQKAASRCELVSPL